MIKIITYTDARMTMSASRCTESAIRIGRADQYSIWTPADLSLEFKQSMASVLQHERGAGFYCWKPYVVHREMCQLTDGDILVWCDAGNTWVEDMHKVIAAMDQNILFFDNGYAHGDWCKMDTLIAILGVCSTSHLVDVCKGPQVQASTFFIRVTPQTRKFVQEWYAWSLMPGMIDNEPSELPNTATFREHRWDQSILCCLQIKYGYNLHWFPSHTNLHRPGAQVEYPIMFEHHRKRNAEW